MKRLNLKSTGEATGATSGSEEEQAPSCPMCGGRGWVRADVPFGHADFGRAVPCRCQLRESKTQRLQRLQRYSNLGPLTSITLESTNPRGRFADKESQRLFQAAYEAAREFGRQPRGWLVLTGPSGCGKTHVAAAIANACMSSDHPAFFIAVPDLLDHLRATFAPDSPVSYDELFEQVRNAPVLVLDDLGHHSGTPWAQEKLYQVLNHRFNARLPTVIALSVPLERLDERLRVRLVGDDFSRVLLLGQKAAPLLECIGGLDNRMLEAMTFENFDVQGNQASEQQRQSLERALRASSNYARDPDGWLLLSGPNGCGKTHLAVAIINYRRKRGLPTVFAVVPDLLDHLRATFAPDSLVSYDQAFEHVKTAPFLVLDDLGAQSSTPWALEKLYQIVAYRHNLRLPTVITTSLLLEDIPSAIRSRLKDVRVVADTLPIDAPDYRDQGRRPTGRPRARP